MQQVVDLEGSAEFQQLKITLVSISTDSLEQLAKAVQEFGVHSPHLSDEGGRVSQQYGVLKWAMPNGEPGHTFVLVGKDGKVKWIRDYGAPENGGLMYVPVSDLIRELRPLLPREQPQQESTPAQPVARGQQLYETYCQGCHGGVTGGTMMDMPPKHNANGHTWHHPDCQLTDIVMNGSDAMGDMMRRMMGTSEDVPRMPKFKETLTEAQVKDILAYIKTWWTEEQRQVQQQITQQACSDS